MSEVIAPHPQTWQPKDGRDVFVSCEWACEHCHESGNSLVWPHARESKDETALRFGRETRGRCVEGCRFNAMPLWAPPAVGILQQGPGQNAEENSAAAPPSNELAPKGPGQRKAAVGILPHPQPEETMTETEKSLTRPTVRADE